MTDREKLTAIVEALCESWEEKEHSIIIRDSRTRLIFTPEGEIKSIIRNGKRYGNEN